MRLPGATVPCKALSDVGSSRSRRHESVNITEINLRIGTPQRLQKAPRLVAAVDRFGETLFGRYTVIEESRFRWRALQS